MKSLVIYSLILVLLTFTGCQSEKIESVAQPIPQKTAEFKREVFDAEKYPGLVAIGKLKIEKSWCAMTLVAEDIAITAGHCLVAQAVDLFNNEKRLKELTTVQFKSKDGKEIPNIRIEKVLVYSYEPDFAIVKLTQKVPKEIIQPVKISDMTFTDILGNSEKLGCAGFNGDKELGKRGENLTISRNIKIYYEESNSKRIDTNCVSTNGGSGGLFFEEKYNAETKLNEYYLLGVIWGVTGDNFDMNGEKINDKDTITSITPVKVFKDKLLTIIEKE